VLVAAHHDTAPSSPSAHEAGGGPGLLIELARVFAHDPKDSRTLVFASFDGGGPGSRRGGGAKVYLATLGPQAKDVVAVLSLGGVGWKEGAPVIQTVGHPTKGAPRSYSICPAWLARATLAGAARAEAPLRVGDPGLFAWLYQPAVRTFRLAGAEGEEAALADAGFPTVLLDDSPATAAFPGRDQPTDTADKLDIDALARAGQSAVGALRAIMAAPRGPATEPIWFAAFGRVFGAGVVVVIGILSLVPVLVRGFNAGGLSLVARLAHAVLFGVLLWRHPILALTVLVLPNLAAAVGSLVLSLVAFAGAFAIVATGFIGWRRGIVTGTWLEPWEIALFVLALALSLFPSRPTEAKSRPATFSARPTRLPKGRKRRPRAR
jgi:hypothetical protein